jgi:superfamily I DNA/RNA helicase
MEPSSFQKRIYDEVQYSDTNIIIGAVAGSGKTTTLLGCLDLIPKGKDVVFLAFNNNIVNELKSRIKRKDVTITTMHSFCWRALMKNKGYKSELKPNKSQDYIKKILLKNKIDIKRTAYYQYVLSNVVDLMRMTLTFDPDDVIKLADHHDLSINGDEALMCIDLLSMMDKEDHIFDFTDMIYRVVSESLRLPKFDYIFVDESQDLSRCQQRVISMIKKKEGRLVAVGDPSQAIYGFAGADIDSYGRLRTLFDNTVELPLSVNYRCGTKIVNAAKQINPQIEPFERNREGIVRDGFIDEIRSGDWVLCRNLKPLVLANLYFLSIGIKSFVKGSDIGVGLIALINKIGCDTTKSMLVKYRQTISKEREKLIKLGMRNPDSSEKIDNMNQKFDILQVLSEGISFTRDLKENIRQIFREQGEGICLSTIHKSKGLENDNVFILCPELIPNRFAVQEWQLKQEDNLLYVAITRAKKKLIFLSDYEEVIENQKNKLQNRKEL